MNSLYKSIGISKQAVHRHYRRQLIFDEKIETLLMEAQELRGEHPGCGVEKMYHTLQPDFIGRDRFISLFMDLGFRLEHQKNERRTTFSSPVYYPNLIKGYEVKSPNTIWQTDITYIYIKEEDRFYYAVFIIDVYTKKIVGYQLSNHMRATANKAALEMALKENGSPKIHHSDRGSQYVSRDYIALLKENNIAVSMSLCAQDNAYAERINKTIKEEYLNHWKPKNYNQLKSYINKAVMHYNHKRKHNNIMKLTPTIFEKMYNNNEMKTVPILTIFDNEINTKTVNLI